jgi:hypothetical protein
MMADFSITSLRGGLNEDAPDGIADDQVTVADNVEWVVSKLGERRLGSLGIDLDGLDTQGATFVTWSHRHLPLVNHEAAQQWLALFVTGTNTVFLTYKDAGGWHAVTLADAIDPSLPFMISSVSFNGKLFLAYDSGVDRLHVWDGFTVRRTGLAEPAAPVVADFGTGTYTGTRYFRVRYVGIHPSGKIERRSEPSDATTFTPSGTGSVAAISKPASIGEGETHWEVEASLDNATFYRLARLTVGTPVYNDNVVFADGYANAPGAVQSAPIGDYALIPSVRHVIVDDDRLMGAGSWEDDALSSRVIWTVVNGDITGDGNDERVPTSTNNFKDLNTLAGGRITNMVGGIQGYVFVTKFSQTYRLSRTGVRANAYDAICVTEFRGAIEKSLVAALDTAGNPMLFGLDPSAGPWRYGSEGLEPCGLDVLQATWPTVNLNAVFVPSLSVFVPETRQIHWWVPTGSVAEHGIAAHWPRLRMVLHIDRQRKVADGWRGGWSLWPGPSAVATSVNLGFINLDTVVSDGLSSNVLVPFIGKPDASLFWRTTVGEDDNGTDYSARIVTKPYMHGDLLNQFESQNGVLFAKAADGVALKVTMIADFGLVEKEVDDVDLSPTAAEAWVIRTIDNVGLAEIRALQLEFEDTATPSGTWRLERFGLKEVIGQRA